MNQRRAFILDMVAENYIRSARPVASSFIAEHLDLSSATIRNELAALEYDGFLQQPHTSAGRTPTKLGFETYAHKFIPPGHLTEQQLSLLSLSLNGTHGDHFLQNVANATSMLSGYAVLVRLPANPDIKALEIHLSCLSSTRILAVVILENGLIRQLSLELNPVPNEAVLREAEQNLRQLAVPLKELPEGIKDIAKRAKEELSNTLLALAAALPQITPPRIFSQGLKQVLSEPESSDPEFVRSLVERFENPEDLDNLDDLSLSLDEPLASIAAKLSFGPSQAQLIVLGPTRMRYKQALTVAHGVTQMATQLN